MLLDSLHLEGVSLERQPCVRLWRSTNAERSAIDGALENSLRIIHGECKGCAGACGRVGRPIADGHDRRCHVADLPAVFSRGWVHVPASASGLDNEVM